MKIKFTHVHLPQNTPSYIQTGVLMVDYKVSDMYTTQPNPKC